MPESPNNFNKAAESTSGEQWGDEYLKTVPEFQSGEKPERRFGISVSDEKAKQLGEMPMRSAYDAEVTVKQWLDDGLESGEISIHDDLSPEQKIESNRNAFFDIQKRRAFIENLYPVLTENREWDDPELVSVPTSIRREYSQGESLCRHLLLSVKDDKSVIRYPNGMMMPSSYRNSDAANYLGYQEARKLNDEIFDQDAFASFEAPRQDVEKIKEQLGGLVGEIRATTNLDSLSNFNTLKLLEQGKIPGVGIESDIDAALEINKIDAIGTISHEVSRQNLQIRQDFDREEVFRAWDVAEEIKGERHKLFEEYQKANIFQRSLMLASGYRRKLRALDLEMSRNTTISMRLQKDYEKIWGRWDPENRRYPESE